MFHFSQFSQDRTTKALVSFIVANNHPFSFVDQPLLKELFATFGCDYNLTSATTVKRMIVASYELSKGRMREIFNNIENGIAFFYSQLSIAIGLYLLNSSYV